MTKWARILKDDTVITKRAKGGQVRSEKAYRAGTETPLPNAHLEELTARGSAEEIDQPEGKGTDKAGNVVDRTDARVAPPPPGSAGDDASTPGTADDKGHGGDKPPAAADNAAASASAAAAGSGASAPSAGASKGAKA